MASTRAFYRRLKKAHGQDAMNIVASQKQTAKEVYALAEERGRYYLTDTKTGEVVFEADDIGSMQKELGDRAEKIRRELVAKNWTQSSQITI